MNLFSPALFFLLLALGTNARALEDKAPWVSAEKSGGLKYKSEANGDRIPDFSHAGFGGGGVTFPDFKFVVSLSPSGGDDGPRIQAAIDLVSAMKPDEKGVRGGILLRKGRYSISGQLRLRSSGLVLMGEGSETILVATGVDRRALVLIEGRGMPQLGSELKVASERIPVGARELNLESTQGLKPGQTILIERPCTPEWIKAVGMGKSPGPTGFYWRPGMVTVTWDRVVTTIKGKLVSLDAPLTTALEPEFGGAVVKPYTWEDRVSKVSIGNLKLVSEYDRSRPKDEAHSWIGIAVDKAADVWIEKVEGHHFSGSLVDIGPGAKWVTVRDCQYLEPVSEYGGYRRHAFMVRGQQVLVQGCRSEDARMDFVAGYLAAGPIVFLDCEALRSGGHSGSMGSWTSGLLFDNVNIDGGALALDNLETAHQGIGWSAVNSVAWQCSASLMICREPPGAHNWAIGVWGQFLGDGHWQVVNGFAEPDSLYRAQLEQRLGISPKQELKLPTASSAKVPDLDALVPGLAATLASAAKQAEAPALSLVNGWLSIGGRLFTGRQAEVNWWRGQLSPARSGAEGVSITRFAPGREGRGLTDRLDEVADEMIAENRGVLRHHYGLWYDRRRDDHERVRRVDSEVWPPFYELPWARSGVGRAWDGLSLYDLSKYNPWYFWRVASFAGVARAKGLVLVNEMYFQHNILEAGAHWADYPWRPANCIQKTGFQEPPEYAGGKRIFMADTYYDLSNEVRRELHRSYIRKCLDNLAESTNVIHTLSEEYTGPLHFAQFWTDVVSGWRKEKGLRPFIALSVTKDVQDALLADQTRAAEYDIIELKYWWSTAKGIYAPKGGENLAPRQHERLWKGGRPDAGNIASMVWEYRSRFPDKAVCTPLGENFGWAVLAAGGSMPALPRGTDADLLAALIKMRPLGPASNGGSTTWTLADPKTGYFVYMPKGGAMRLTIKPEASRARLRPVSLASGQLEPAVVLDADKNGGITLDAASGKAAAFWVDLTNP